MKKIKLPYKLLEYDIEVSHLWCRSYQLGQQILRHKNLIAPFNRNHIICISWKWYHEDTVTVISYRDPDMLKKFIAVVKEADVVLGKNNWSFDDKHINAALLVAGEESLVGVLPDISDDLQHQMKKYFWFPSQSLDYLSDLFGFGGKNKMEESDWHAIENMMVLEELIKRRCAALELSKISQVLFNKKMNDVFKLGDTALRKMMEYNKKDVKDTDALLTKALPYIKLKHNASNVNHKLSCTCCGSTNVVREKKIVKGSTRYQIWHCVDHDGYAGKSTYTYKQNSHNPTYGKMVK